MGDIIATLALSDAIWTAKSNYEEIATTSSLKDTVYYIDVM
jgi:hypothetical protein